MIEWSCESTTLAHGETFITATPPHNGRGVTEANVLPSAELIASAVSQALRTLAYWPIVGEIMRRDTSPPLPTSLSADAQRVLRQILALRQLMRQTGTRTTKTQNSILQALAPEVLAEVAEALASLDEGGAR